LLDEVGQAISGTDKSQGGGGDHQYWEQALNRSRQCWSWRAA
jgi:hypothetical protein